MSCSHQITPETDRTWRGHEAEARHAVRKLDKALEAVHEALSAYARAAEDAGVLDRFDRTTRTTSLSPAEVIEGWLETALEIDTSDLIDSEKLSDLRKIAEGE